MLQTINGIDLLLLAGLVFCFVRWRRCCSSEGENAELRRRLHKANLDRQAAEDQVTTLCAIIRRGGKGHEVLRKFLSHNISKAEVHAAALEDLQERINRGVV